MEFKKRFNEIYVSLFHLPLLMVLPIFWMVFMDEGSLITRFLFPLTLISLMLVLTKKIVQVLYSTKEEL